jgi:hypothetical protein
VKRYSVTAAEVLRSRGRATPAARDWERSPQKGGCSPPARPPARQPASRHGS